MNDPTPTPDDDLIRRALQREAEGVEAGDQLLDRTLTAASRPAARPHRRVLVAAAVIAAVAIGVGAAVSRDDDARVDTLEDPTTTTADTVTSDDLASALLTLFPCTTQGTVQVSFFIEPEGAAAVRAALHADARTLELVDASSEDIDAALHGASEGRSLTASSATYQDEEDATDVVGAMSDLPGVVATSTTSCAQGGPTASADPAAMAIVREDGWLVYIDLQTGDPRELYFGGDPGAPPSGQEEGGPQHIDAVDLSPDGRWVYFSTCCEPASGLTYRISVDGGEPEPITSGRHPRVSPDGRFVATATGEAVNISGADGGAVVATKPTACCAQGLAWSPDGTQLAAVRTSSDGSPAQAVLLDWDGTALTAGDPGKPDNPGSFVSWTPDGMLVVSSGGPVDDDRSLSQDTGYHWLLWVDQDGVVLVQAGHESSARTPVAGLPEALVADW